LEIHVKTHKQVNFCKLMIKTILKASRDKQAFFICEHQFNWQWFFSSRTMKNKNKRTNFFNYWKKRTFSHRVHTQQQIYSFKSEGKIKAFSGERKLKHFSSLSFAKWWLIKFSKQKGNYRKKRLRASKNILSGSH
jgi:hypothetical protein